MEFVEMLEELLDGLRSDAYNADTEQERQALEEEIAEVEFAIKMAKWLNRRGRYGLH